MLTGTVDHHSFAFHHYQTLLFQSLEYAANHFAGAADNTANFLTGNFDLHSVRVSHCIWLFAEFQQSTCYATCYIEEGQVAYLTCSGAQATCHLTAEGE